CVEAHDWRASLLLHDIEERATVGRPVERTSAPATRCGIVAEDGTAHIKVVIGGKVLRLLVWRPVQNPKGGLRIGTNRLSEGAVEGQPAAIWTKDEIVNTHRNRGEFFGVSARGGDRVNIRVGEFVIGLVDAPREKVNARAIVAPDELTFVEISSGKLLRLSEFIRGPRYLE